MKTATAQEIDRSAGIDRKEEHRGGDGRPSPVRTDPTHGPQSNALDSAAAKRGRKSLQERLQQIETGQQQLADQRRKVMASIREEDRRRQAEIDAVAGAACRAAAANDETIREFLRAALDRHVRDEKLRALLKREGLL